MTGEWSCSAYGDLEGVNTRGWCFMSSPRSCSGLDVCQLRMAIERRRVYHQIQQLGHADPDVWGPIAADITSPEQLLNGPGTLDPPDDGGLR